MACDVERARTRVTLTLTQPGILSSQNHFYNVAAGTGEGVRRGDDGRGQTACRTAKKKKK